MKGIDSLWQKLNGSETINTALDLASGTIYEPPPIDGDLFSSRFTLPRSRLEFAGQLAVPDASGVVVWGRGEFCQTFGPGVHSLRLCPAGRLLGRLVDMSQHSLNINLSDLYTADLARLLLQIDVEFKVDDPRVIIQLKSPLQTLTRMVEGTTRQVIESLPHRSLFAGSNSTELTNKAALERQIRLALHAESALKGLRVVSIKIIKVEGDPTHLALVAQEALAEQQRLAEEATLKKRQQLAISERELTLFQVETERLATASGEGAVLDDAERQASIFELESARREFQHMMEEMRLVHEEAMARINALAQAVTALGDPRHVAVSNATYAHTNNINGRDQALAQVIDSLTEPQAIRVSTSSNGHASHAGSNTQSTSTVEGS